MGLAVYTEYMLNSWGAVNMFYYYAFLNLLAFAFMKYFVKETYGLSDREKKQVYQSSIVDDQDYAKIGE